MAEDFKIVGEWLTVTKRKKKPPTACGTKTGAIAKGNQVTKSVNVNFDKSKSKVPGSLKLANSEFQEFKVGPANHVAINAQENKKRRFRSGIMKKS